MNIFLINTIQTKFLRSGFFFRNVDQHPTELAPVQVHKFPFESSAAAAAAGERFDKIGGGEKGFLVLPGPLRWPIQISFVLCFAVVASRRLFCRSGIFAQESCSVRGKKKISK